MFTTFVLSALALAFTFGAGVVCGDADDDKSLAATVLAGAASLCIAAVIAHVGFDL